ncbi:hypothetical protein CR513_30219, partial [Mucuna pruriens]
MANRVSHRSLHCIILGLIITGLIEVEGNVCSQPMGACGPLGECDRRCKAAHSGGQGLLQAHPQLKYAMLVLGLAVFSVTKTAAMQNVQANTLTA